MNDIDLLITSVELQIANNPTYLSEMQFRFDVSRPDILHILRSMRSDGLFPELLADAINGGCSALTNGSTIHNILMNTLIFGMMAGYSLRCIEEDNSAAVTHNEL